MKDVLLEPADIALYYLFFVGVMGRARLVDELFAELKGSVVGPLLGSADDLFAWVDRVLASDKFAFHTFPDWHEYGMRRVGPVYDSCVFFDPSPAPRSEDRPVLRVVDLGRSVYHDATGLVHERPLRYMPNAAKRPCKCASFFLGGGERIGHPFR